MHESIIVFRNSYSTVKRAITLKTRGASSIVFFGSNGEKRGKKFSNFRRKKKMRGKVENVGKRSERKTVLTRKKNKVEKERNI